jgi:hypothetical protein
VWFSDCFGVWVKGEFMPEGISPADRSGTIGLQALPSYQLPFSIVGGNKTPSIPTSLRNVRQASEIGEMAANPFMELDESSLCFWKAARITLAALASLPARRVRGQYYGTQSIALVNEDPGIVLVLGPDFAGHGDVYSNGPVVVDGAHLMGSVFSDGIIWLRNGAFPRATVAALYIFAETSVNVSQGQSWLSPVLRVPPVRPPVKPVSVVFLARSVEAYWDQVAEGRSPKPSGYWVAKLSEASPIIRYLAVQRLTELDELSDAGRQALEPLLSDDDIAVANAAAQSLGKRK